MSSSAPIEASRPPRTSRHQLDSPIGTGPFVFGVGETVVVSGWAFLEPPGLLIPAAVLEIVSDRTGAVTRIDAERRSRPDVVSHFGADHLLMSGFLVHFTVDDRFRGAYCVRLRQIEGTVVQPAADLFSFSVPLRPREADARSTVAASFLAGAGLEIGALQRRLVVPDQCAVTYVDRMPVAELRNHYPELRDQPLQEPDLIDDGETLARVAANSQDFVIANHFLEHCENPILTIENLARVLRQDGILYMAVPDKRFTFDIDRPITSYRELAETRRHGQRANREALYREWAALVMHTAPPDLDIVARKLLDDKYSIHFNVWSLPDLLEFLLRARADFALAVMLEWVVCSDNEVILILRKRAAGDGPQGSSLKAGLASSQKPAESSGGSQE